MKSKVRLLATLIGVFSLLFLTTCKKDKSMDALIIVKLHHDTMVLVPNAEVLISVPINSSPQNDISDIVGYTDLNGEFRQTFDLPVQLDVRVTWDTLSGIGVLNMNKPGKDVTKRIYIY